MGMIWAKTRTVVVGTLTAMMESTRKIRVSRILLDEYALMGFLMADRRSQLNEARMKLEKTLWNTSAVYWILQAAAPRTYSAQMKSEMSIGSVSKTMQSTTDRINT